MNGSELIAALERGDVPAVSVFAGEEPWFGEEGIRAARRAFLGEDQEGYLSLDGPRREGDREGTPLGAALDEGRTVPMFGGRKVVAWRGRGLEEEDVELLAGVAKASPAFARFVLTLPSLGAGAKRKLEKAGARVADCKRLYDTPWPGKPAFATPLNDWTVARARLRGFRMGLAVAHALTTAVGNDLAGIEAALGKLQLGFRAGSEITEDDLGTLLGGGREYDAFAFGEAVFARDAAKAFRIARSSFREGVTERDGRRRLDSGGIVARLLWSFGWQLDKVYAASLARAEGMSAPGAGSAASKGGRANPGAVRSAEYAAGFTREELLRHHVILERAEADVRSAVPEEVVIDRLIAAVTGERDG